MVKKILVALFLIGCSFGFSAWPVAAQSLGNYQKATVESVIEQRKIEGEAGTDFYTQIVKIKLAETDETVVIPVGSEFQPLRQSQLLSQGMSVIVGQQTTFDGQLEYIIIDVYRLPLLAFLFVGFVLLVLVVARLRGLSSLAGMLLSGAVLFGFMLPQILRGTDPVMISLMGGVGIAAATIYLSHGFHFKSHLALGSLTLTLVAVTILSAVSVRLARLVGLGSEEAFFLQYGPTAQINLQGLLLGGIILGALGVLDDIVVSQISVVEQLKLANPKLRFEDLYARSLAVGKDHVASLVNTLVLAYVGANLPLFLLFYLNQEVPLWVTINNQLISEEVVRTLVGSMGLVLAVPFATLVAAFYSKQFQESKEGVGKKLGHSHHH